MFCFAEQATDPGANARMSVGSVRLSPSIDFSGGIDSNVFNSADEPKSDFVWTLSPKTQASVRLGPARMTGKGSVDFVYFQRIATERSVNLDGSIKLAVPLNRIEPFASASLLKTRQRPSFEIDARSLRHERSVSLGTAARIAAKTTVEFVTTRSELEFDAGAVFLDASLRELLNRTTTTINMSVRHRLTPLTTLNMASEATDERVVFSPIRDARSIRVAPGFEFAPQGLLSGKVSVGYRLFDPRDPSVPDFRGTVASVDLAYTLLGDTRFLFKANRDVEYSYLIAAPYYVLSGIGGEIGQRVSNSIGITVRGGRHRLSYRSRSPEIADDLSRADRLLFYGGGFFRKIGPDLRVNISVDYFRRLSPLALREYSGLRVGSSVVYGFQP
jgi:hypothetical protein